MKKIFTTIIVVCAFATVQAQTIKNYTLQNIENQRVNLHDIKGDKLTVIDFWTTWCRPCKKAIPQLNKIYKQYKGKGVQVIGLNSDGPRTVAKVPTVSKGLQIQYPILIDMNSEIMNAHNFSTFPTLVIVDETFKIKYIHEGFVPGDEEEIISAIEKQLTK
ncbi:TlpA family protein disulfide reductase [Reichenbachiella versicolor]|uniref:TlpA family protein disulfide reductase n=1 Tax=Reichenbachiella versicolor TaxID=1821036 RepID=UPI0013A59428|nr:TlpA disulfide reductase family protein [Reichenbachiella versicolor]